MKITSSFLGLWLLFYGLPVMSVKPDSVQLFSHINNSAGQAAVEAFLNKDKNAKKGSMTKLGFDLGYLFQEYKQYILAGGLKVLKYPFKSSLPMVRLKNEKVVVDAVAATDSQKLANALKKLGMENISIYGRMVSGYMPVVSLDQLAQLVTLQLARPAYSKLATGSVTSQGDLAQFSSQARTQFNVNGEGVIVGTLSDSYNCLNGAPADVLSNDLPSGVIVLSEEAGCGSGTDEGRAMMQIVHDVAPGADQVFHSAFNGMASFANGIVDLAVVASANIINDDVIYFAEPMFQDGIVAQAVDTVKAQGVAYFSAAGNSSDNSYESVFSSSGIAGYSSGSIRHDFDKEVSVDSLMQITIPANTQVIFVLQWEDPFFSVSGSPGAATDMDIILYSDKGQPKTGGIDNNIGGDAVEIFSFASSPGPAKTYQIAIEHVSGPVPGRIKLVYFGNMTINEYATSSGTSYGHPIAAGGQAVGAARYEQTPAYGVSPPLLEYFSSKGGVPILFDVNGNPVSIVRDKPDFVAPDGGDTTFFGSDYEGNGYPNFFGTSAATPHAAAVAALLKQFDNTLSPDTIYSILQSTAVDMQSPGFDYLSGYGLINAVNALASLDDDQDLVPNSIDNCPTVSNPDQQNNDQDQQGDVCDPDDDNDGLLDTEELVWQTDPFIEDTDEDGLRDGDEVNTYNSNPVNHDTDGDGLSDGDEIIFGFDPLSSSKGYLAPRGNPDDQLNVGDLVVMQRVILGLVTPTSPEIILADMNSDGQLSIVDLLLFQKILGF